MSLYRRHPGLDTVRDLVAAQCAAEGIKNPKAVAAAIERRCAELKPLLDENPNLHGQELRDLLSAKATPPAGPELEERNRAALAPVQTPIYGPNEAEGLALAARENAHLAKHQPVLHRQLSKGAGSSPAVVRRLLEEQLERERRA